MPDHRFSTSRIHRQLSYPRFLSGRGLFAALLVRGETIEDLNSSPLCESRSFLSLSSCDSFRIFWAAFLDLLGRFFGVVMITFLVTS